MTRDKQSDDSTQAGNQSGKRAEQDKQTDTAGRATQASQSQQKEGEHPQKSHRGFAAMDESRQRDIASAGGRAAHEKGTAHEFDSEEARIAGRKGGEVVSENREHMAEIGRKGGEARQAAAAGNRGQDKSRSTTAKDQSESGGAKNR